MIAEAYSYAAILRQFHTADAFVAVWKDYCRFEYEQCPALLGGRLTLSPLHHDWRFLEKVMNILPAWQLT